MKTLFLVYIRTYCSPGHQREIIEFYFHKGYMYKNIVNLLEKYHDVSINIRTLKRRLKDYGLKRRESIELDV